MSPETLAILPNLSIGVVSVLALVYVVILFMKYLTKRDTEHMVELKEREMAMRALEREVRTSITTQLSDNTSIMKEVMQALKR